MSDKPVTNSIPADHLKFLDEIESKYNLPSKPIAYQYMRWMIEIGEGMTTALYSGYIADITEDVDELGYIYSTIHYRTDKGNENTYTMPYAIRVKNKVTKDHYFITVETKYGDNTILIIDNDTKEVPTIRDCPFCGKPLFIEDDPDDILGYQIYRCCNAACKRVNLKQIQKFAEIVSTISGNVYHITEEAIEEFVNDKRYKNLSSIIDGNIPHSKEFFAAVQETFEKEIFEKKKIRALYRALSVTFGVSLRTDIAVKNHKGTDDSWHAGLRYLLKHCQQPHVIDYVTRLIRKYKLFEC